MKVGIKHKSTMIYKEASEIEVADGVTLMDLLNEQAKIKALFSELIDKVSDSYVVEKDKTYLINIKGKLQRIDKLDLYEDIKSRVPLGLMKEEDGKIKVDKRKVAVL